MSATSMNRVRSRNGSAADEVNAALKKRERRSIPQQTMRPTDVPGIRFDVLGRLVAQKRTAEGLSLRGAERITGISASTLSRLENGKTLELDHVFTLTRWLNLPIEQIFGPPPQDVPQIIKATLLADPKLSKDESDALCGTFVAIYRQMTNGRV